MQGMAPPPQMQAPQVLGAPIVDAGPSEGTSSNSSQHGGEPAAGVAVNGGTPVSGVQAIPVQPGAAAEYRNMAQSSVSPHQPQPAGPQIYQQYMVDGMQNIMGEC